MVSVTRFQILVWDPFEKDNSEFQIFKLRLKMNFCHILLMVVGLVKYI